MRNSRHIRAAAGAVVVAAALSGVADANAAGRRAAARPDVAVVRVAAPRSTVAGTPFQLDVTLAERTRRAAADAVVTVTGGASPVETTTNVRAGGRARVSVPLTLAAAGTYSLVVRAQVARDSSARNNVATAVVTTTDFAVAPSQVLVPSFVGYGAQFGQNEYAQVSRNAGVTDDNVGDMEQKVVALGPQFARIFFNRAAFTDADQMQSFVRTAQLAQRAGATIEVTWQTSWGIDTENDMPRFADVLADLTLHRGVTNLRWVSVQNEPNLTKLTFDQYDHMVRLVDAELRADGVRDRIGIMGGELVQNSQEAWLHAMADREADVLDGYSIHVFWDYWGASKLEARLKGVRAIYDTLPPAAQKPLYVTEFGVRGHRATGDAGPGFWDDGTTSISLTALSGFQHAWFAALAPRYGFVAASKWDAYWGRYDNTPQAYNLIGPPTDGWPLYPGYWALRLLTETVHPGWKVVGVSGTSGTKLVTAFAGPAGELSLVGLDSAGSMLNGVSPTVSTYSIGGLPPGATFSFLLWNADGSGTIAPATRVTADAAGVVKVGAPLQSIFALTTLPIA